ncbi:helix-turn-helix domain-containing protein [Hufsiella ginkgonis]|uniref:Helix-turn-helix domain-containing protein n=1 Tax=Hufsiella ginkgonis TaxID=2695274 RepID=A0A7K1Y1A1_9SPHI|nr:helix-turn-helix transcriptional regulator [Hufsiella ginkgonis]MXV16858.1 helix-turn-helix domain-containing protein [Hufsiella ginkgonis]
MFNDHRIRQIFAKNLRGIRMAKKLTQQQFADQLGVSRPTYGSYEEARATPQLASLIVISNTVGFDMATLTTTDLYGKGGSNGA